MVSWTAFQESKKDHVAAQVFSLRWFYFYASVLHLLPSIFEPKLIKSLIRLALNVNVIIMEAQADCDVWYVYAFVSNLFRNL